MCKKCIADKYDNRCGSINDVLGVRCLGIAAYVLTFSGNHHAVCCLLHGALTVKQIVNNELRPGHPLTLEGIETIETM